MGDSAAAVMAGVGGGSVVEAAARRGGTELWRAMQGGCVCGVSSAVRHSRLVGVEAVAASEEGDRRSLASRPMAASDGRSAGASGARAAEV